MMLFFIVLILVPLLFKRNVQNLFKKNVSDDKLFADFICDDFFVYPKYELATDIVVLADSVLTELIFTQMSSDYEFFIKSKFYIEAINIEIQYCSKIEFQHLKDEVGIPVYVLLGIGGPAYFPNSLYLIPLDNLTSNKIDTACLPKYAIPYTNHDIDFNSY